MVIITYFTHFTQFLLLYFAPFCSRFWIFWKHLSMTSLVVAETMLVYVFALILALIKTVVIIQKRGQIKKLWNRLEQPPFVANHNRAGDKEEKLIKESLWINTIQCRTYWIMIAVCLLSSTANTLYSRLRSNDYHDWALPFGPFSILNVTYSPNYEITWIYQNIAVGFLGMQLATIGLVTGCTLAHISYQFKIIQNNIKRILLISYEKMQNVDEPGTSGINLTGEIDGSTIPWKYLKSTLKEIVEYHLATWIYQTTSAFYIAMQFASADLVTACSLTHISYQFKILQNNIKRILLISYEKMQNVHEPGTSEINLTGEIDGSIIPWKYLKSSLKETVEYHLAVTGLVEELERLVNTLLLTIFLNTLALLCLTVYTGSMLSPDDPRVFSSIGESLSTCLQIALVCYWGEQVVVQSEEVGTAVWESNFPGTDIRFQKCLVLMIRRSKNAGHLTAGKFTVIRLTTLVWVLRTSYSAFMMLRSKHV